MGNLAGRYDEYAEPSRDFTPIPEGTYRMKIIESSWEPISKRDDKGQCLKLTWQVETGPHDGRLVWQRLSLEAENMGEKTAVVRQIANSHLASIRLATDKISPKDASELHHIPCAVRVGLSKPHEQYAQQNEVKAVEKIAASGARPGTSSSPQRQAPPKAAASGASAPWRKRELDDEVPF
jgi:hypothetical protein